MSSSVLSGVGTAVVIGLSAGTFIITLPLFVIGYSGDMTDEHRILKFRDIVSPGTYDDLVDKRLKFVTAIAAMEIKHLCDSNDATMLTWNHLEQIMNNCVILEKGDDSIVNVTKTLSLSDIENVENKRDHLKQWLWNVIQHADSDVYETTRLNDNEIDFILDVALKDVGVHGLFTLLCNSVHAYADILDIGFIRFPTSEFPYIKLYRIRISSRAEGTRTVFFSNGVDASMSVEVASRKYYPRMDLIDDVSTDIIEKSIMSFSDTLVT
jgi:hypothetical protein